MRQYPSLAHLRNFTRNLDPINNENQPQIENEIGNDDNLEHEDNANNVSFFYLILVLVRSFKQKCFISSFLLMKKKFKQQTKLLLTFLTKNVDIFQ